MKDNNTQGNTDTMREILEALKDLRRLFEDSIRADLNARYPYGKPTDRFGR